MMMPASEGENGGGQLRSTGSRRQRSAIAPAVAERNRTGGSGQQSRKAPQGPRTGHGKGGGNSDGTKKVEREEDEGEEGDGQGGARNHDHPPRLRDHIDHRLSIPVPAAPIGDQLKSVKNVCIEGGGAKGVGQGGRAKKGQRRENKLNGAKKNGQNNKRVDSVTARPAAAVNTVWKNK